MVRVAQHLVQRALPTEDAGWVVLERVHDQGGSRCHAHGAGITRPVAEHGKRHVRAVASVAVRGRRVETERRVDASNSSRDVRVIEVQTRVRDRDGFPRAVKGERGVAPHVHDPGQTRSNRVVNFHDVCGLNPEESPVRGKVLEEVLTRIHVESRDTHGALTHATGGLVSARVEQLNHETGEVFRAKVVRDHEGVLVDDSVLQPCIVAPCLFVGTDPTNRRVFREEVRRVGLKTNHHGGAVEVIEHGRFHGVQRSEVFVTVRVNKLNDRQAVFTRT